MKFFSVAGRCATLFMLTLCTVACSTNPVPPMATAPLNQTDREARLQQLNRFTLNAAIGVKAPSDSVNGSLDWQQQQAYYQASMSNVLGLTVFELSTSAKGATVVVDGQTHQADNAAELFRYLSGWSLPLADMPQWLKGLASASAFDVKRDALGRVTQFVLVDSQQQRWTVSYPEFFADSLALPKRITLQSADTRLKLVIRRWNF